jgi:hypothetical protein
MGKTEEKETSLVTSESTQACERCGCEVFKVWVKWGIWYALCASCFTEYGLYPKGHFTLIRDPGGEDH